MYEFVLVAVDFKHEAVVSVGEDLLVDDGEVESLRPPYGDVPEVPLIPLVQ